MVFQASITSTLPCRLERAFKAPLLYDVSRVHTGFLTIPKAPHTTEDETWDQPGGSKRIFAARAVSFPDGEASIDRVLERVEKPILEN